MNKLFLSLFLLPAVCLAQGLFVNPPTVDHIQNGDASAGINILDAGNITISAKTGQAISITSDSSISISGTLVVESIKASSGLGLIKASDASLVIAVDDRKYYGHNGSTVIIDGSNAAARYDIAVSGLGFTDNATTPTNAVVVSGWIKMKLTDDSDIWIPYYK